LIAQFCLVLFNIVRLSARSCCACACAGACLALPLMQWPSLPCLEASNRQGVLYFSETSQHRCLNSSCRWGGGGGGGGGAARPWAIGAACSDSQPAATASAAAAAAASRPMAAGGSSNRSTKLSALTM